MKREGPSCGVSRLALGCAGLEPPKIGVDCRWLDCAHGAEPVRWPLLLSRSRSTAGACTTQRAARARAPRALVVFPRAPPEVGFAGRQLGAAFALGGVHHPHRDPLRARWLRRALNEGDGPTRRRAFCKAFSGRAHCSSHVNRYDHQRQGRPRRLRHRSTCAPDPAATAAARAVADARAAAVAGGVRARDCHGGPARPPLPARRCSARALDVAARAARAAVAAQADGAAGSACRGSSRCCSHRSRRAIRLRLRGRRSRLRHCRSSRRRRRRNTAPLLTAPLRRHLRRLRCRLRGEERLRRRVTVVVLPSEPAAFEAPPAPPAAIVTKELGGER